MKRKSCKVPKERNQFVAAALFRKAGAHTKTNKAKRRLEKVKLRTGSSVGSSTRLLIEVS
jgi:hypothetical protein